tara:strand:+ start:244 stop:489 length:246 start_codon:yes stop_codon:yes gene_type:complete
MYWLPNEEQGGYSVEREFFFRELTEVWKEDGLERQAYFLVKHVNFSLSDVDKLTLLERNTYIKLLKEEHTQQKEELEKVRR